MNAPGHAPAARPRRTPDTCSRRATLLTLVGLIAILAVGCSRPTEARALEVAAEPDACCGCGKLGEPYRAPEADFCDPALQETLRVGRVVQHRDPERVRLQVHVPIRNVSEGTVHVAAQIEFRDECGGFYGDRTPRRVLTLAPGQTRWLRATSARGCAEDLALRLCAVTPRSR